MRWWKSVQSTTSSSALRQQLARTHFDGLLPSDNSSRKEAVNRQLPRCARNWGRFLDTSDLLPGDLVLTRSITPDNIANQIIEAQIDGGLPIYHAQWTHAAVYLGDGEYICESSFKERGFRWGVNVRSIFEYCDGNYALRARRPIVDNEQQRIRIAIGAMSRIGNKYSFLDINSIKNSLSNGSYFRPGQKLRKVNQNAIVCSALYQDAYNFSFHGFRITHSHLITPAHLSASSSDFEVSEPRLEWLEIL